MDKKFIPCTENLRQTDFTKPNVETKDKRNIFLFLAAAAMLVVVFIPWFCIGFEIEDLGEFKLRSYGFDSWYGIVGGVLALVAVAGVLYKHIALTMWSSLIAMIIGLFAMNTYPTSRLVIDLDAKVEKEMKNTVKEYDREPDEDYYHYREYDSSRPSASKANTARTILQIADMDLKVPGSIVQIASVAVDILDQDEIFELLDKNSNEDIEIVNHRLGNILFLVFAALGTLMSYLILAKPRKEKVEA